MTSVIALNNDDFYTPLDIVEQLMFGRDWAYDRPSDDELVAEVQSQWCDVRVWSSWRPELDALLLACSFGSRVPSHHYPAMHKLLALANERMWMGHFDLCHEEGIINFRHTLLIAEPVDAANSMIDGMLDMALQECERFYPAFQSVMWGGKPAEEALELAMFETQGEA